MYYASKIRNAQILKEAFDLTEVEARQIANILIYEKNRKKELTDTPKRDKMFLGKKRGGNENEQGFGIRYGWHYSRFVRS